jgi:hypothetical protein
MLFVHVSVCSHPIMTMLLSMPIHSTADSRYVPIVGKDPSKVAAATTSTSSSDATKKAE